MSKREGGVFTYQHHDNRIGSVVVVRFETDFAARTSEFKELGRHLAMQAAFIDPEDDFWNSEPIVDVEYKTVNGYVKAVSKLLGEELKVPKVQRVLV